MIDKYGRQIEYLRISITQKCNMSCIYCNPVPEGGPCNESLTVEDYRTIVETMSHLGIKKVRLTGGEPFLREDICDIVKAISTIEGIEDISATTNGLRLSTLAAPLKKAGLNRINISLDSLDPRQFSHITGGGNLNDVIEGIDAAFLAGLSPVKINVVLIKGVNDDEIDSFIDLAKERSIEVRFIELMPIGSFGENNRDKTVYNSDILLSHPQMKPIPENSHSPATLYSIDGYKGSIGLISPISHKFCSYCNRVRITSDGILKPCLGDNSEVDLMDALRNHPEELEGLIERSIFNKPESHHFNKKFHSKNGMNKIGG
jgi:cyclic pyranopterin phosphate synthase